MLKATAKDAVGKDVSTSESRGGAASRISQGIAAKRKAQADSEAAAAALAAEEEAAAAAAAAAAELQRLKDEAEPKFSPVPAFSQCVLDVLTTMPLNTGFRHLHGGPATPAESHSAPP